MIARRLLDYFDHVKIGTGRLDIEGVSHVVTGRLQRNAFLPSDPVGSAFVHRNRSVLPRARLVGRPVYVDDAADGVKALKRLGPENRTRLIVEDPTRPLAAAAEVSGTARIVTDLPERVVVETGSSDPAYLVLADTFDPGWSATVDGSPAPIRPAYVAFGGCPDTGRTHRRVHLPPGRVHPGPGDLDHGHRAGDVSVVPARRGRAFGRRSPRPPPVGPVPQAALPDTGRDRDRLGLPDRARSEPVLARPVVGQLPSLHLGRRSRGDEGTAAIGPGYRRRPLRARPLASGS